MLCVPGVESVDVSMAVPLAKGPLPSVVLPSRKLTVPVGWTEFLTDGATAAVNVTCCPEVMLLGEAVTPTVVPIVLRNTETTFAVESQLTASRTPSLLKSP